MEVGEEASEGGSEGALRVEACAHLCTGSWVRARGALARRQRRAKGGGGGERTKERRRNRLSSASYISKPPPPTAVTFSDATQGSHVRRYTYNTLLHVAPVYSTLIPNVIKLDQLFSHPISVLHSPFLTRYNGAGISLPSPRSEFLDEEGGLAARIPSDCCRRNESSLRERLE